MAIKPGTIRSDLPSIAKDVAVLTKQVKTVVLDADGNLIDYLDPRPGRGPQDYRKKRGAAKP